MKSIAADTCAGCREPINVGDAITHEPGPVLAVRCHDKPACRRAWKRRFNGILRERASDG